MLKFFLISFSFSVVFFSLAKKDKDIKDTSSVEFIKVFFNGKSDHSFAFEGNESNDEFDMIQPLVDLIDSANYSVDLVAYDLQNMRVGHALANAARRGLRVRVITDIIHRNHAPRFTQPMWDTLRNAGIISFDDAGSIYWPDGRIEELPKRLPNSGANMHHKFCIIDALSESPDDLYLWTGTMNVTYTGPWNTNATLIIKDSGIAAAYLEEYNQMWGCFCDTPDPKKARFHKDKENVSQNVHFVNSTKVEVYFGPQNRTKSKPSISKRVTELIEDYAQHDARFLAFAISSNIPISEALLRRSGRGEIYLYGVIDPAFYARYRKSGDVWAQPEARFGKRMILPGKEIRKLHSKTLLLDAEHPYPDEHTAVTITGSYNFSKAAEEANDENILIIYDNYITNQFYQDFMGVMSRAKGETFHQYPTLDVSEWYDHFRIRDGQHIQIEFETNLPYPVSLLGAQTPRSWAGHADSTYFYSEEAKEKLRALTKGAKLRVVGPYGEVPVHRYSKYHGYILADFGDSVVSINREMIRQGYAQYNTYYKQNEDSVAAFKEYERYAKEHQLGMWSKPEMVGKVIQTSDAAFKENLFPLNINTATQRELEFLPTVGPGRAQTIITHREKNGEFRNFEDLERIKGIGPATIEKLRSLVVFEEKED